MPNYDPLFYWIIEREQIRIRKANDPSAGVWTDDAILKRYRFCNVRREDDRGTIWIREHIREPYAGYPFLWLMLCIARQINWADTLLELINEGAWPIDTTFNPAVMTAVLNRRKARGDKVYTGAYMISAPHDKGADKQAYICEHVIGDLWQRRHEFAANDNRIATLESVHSQLTETKGWGMFMAYQAVVDMRFTALLSNAPDITTWAAAGPGTLRGLNRIHGRELNKALSQAQALDEMREIYAIVQNKTGVAMDFSDVPNALCEVDKYLRVALGQGKPRALYVSGRGS